MYKILLCLRYLKTRYIALACIISVTLGVATMIVVNSVMAGFSSEMRDRIHGLLADVIVETNSLDGVQDARLQMRRVREVAGDAIAAMTCTVEVYGMLTFEYPPGNYITRPITLIGIEPEGKAQVGPLKDYLDSYGTVRDGDQVIRGPLRKADEPPGWELTAEAAAHRRERRLRDWIMFNRMQHGHSGSPEPEELAPPAVTLSPADTVVEPPPFTDAAQAPDFTDQNPQAPAGEPLANPFNIADAEKNPFAQPAAEAPAEEPNLEQMTEPEETRLYVGINLVSYPYDEEGTGKVRTVMMVHPGDNVRISTVTAGRPPQAAHFWATVVDVFRSGMSEYDSNLVFCNLEALQKYRGMISDDASGRIEPGQAVSVTRDGERITGRITGVDPHSGTVRVQPDAAQSVTAPFEVAASEVTPISRAITSIQIRLKDYSQAKEVVKRLEQAFPPGLFSVRTWEQKQGPLLAAVEVESAILNVLLFLIIAVAGFGILAIFFMIVVEKTRDIGILKALGANSGGVMSIFLSYGLALGIVGSGVGVVIGLLFVRYINVIESWITWLTGRKVFDEKIYYFPEIPTSVSPLMVMWVALGAMTIAVLASVLPARRASRLRPVEALRYE